MTRRLLGNRHAEDACKRSGRITRAPPLGIRHLTDSDLSHFAICSAVSLPCLWEPGITRRGPFWWSLASKWILIASIPPSTSAGGCTFTTPLLIVQGPNPSTSTRSFTVIVKSWCQGTFQFDFCVLLNRIPLTA